MTFGLLFVVISFLVGYLAQSICLWIDGKNKFSSPKASKVIPKIIKIRLYKIYLLVKAIYSERDRTYIAEMKKSLVHGRLERRLFNELIKETNSKRTTRIIETVFYYTERNRRKKIPNTTFKFRNFYFIDNIYLENGFGYGIKLVDFVDMFVKYNKYLSGTYLEPNIALKAAKLFGTPMEEKVASLENNILEDRKG